MTIEQVYCQTRPGIKFQMLKGGGVEKIRSALYQY